MTFRDIETDAAVRMARSLIQRRDRQTVAEQTMLASIPAPTDNEGERARYARARFEEIGLDDVHTDAAGNVLGTLPAASVASVASLDAAPVVLAAHLDTVFPEGTDVRPRESAGRIHAPGISDNARGLAAMIAVARALRDASVRLARPAVFVATVGEEGLGDLKGAKHLFVEGSALRRAAAFVAIDGAGMTRIVHRAVGAVRLRVTIRGPGGHSWGDRGAPNPAHALGNIIAGLGGIGIPGADHAVTVGRLGGGTSVNAIPATAWLELDLRSEDPSHLTRLEEQARDRIARGLSEEMERHQRAASLTATVETIGNRPCGGCPPNTALVADAAAATRVIGAEPELVASSTDASVAMSLDIPAIAIGAGGIAGGVHTTDEWFENREGARGVERVLLTVVAATGLARRTRR